VIWILWHRRVGDLKQMEVLAKALGLPFVVKKLRFDWPLYPPLAKLTASSDDLDCPWPDFIFCAEALASVIARRLKKKSGGKIKIVSLARPSGDVQKFDLVLTTAQYRLPKLANVVELMLPLTAPTPATLRLASNKLTVLVGASSPPEIFRHLNAIEMLKALKNHADKNALILNIVTSPRTEREVIEVFEDVLAGPDQVFVWKTGAENHYQRCLDEAGEIVVTSDSASMLGDAVATGKPVYVYRLPRKFTAAETIAEWLFKHAPQSWIFRKGLIEPATDRWLLVERLIDKGYIRWFGQPQKAFEVFDPQVDIDMAVAAIKKL
jgi:uncharacterized protein